MNRCILALGAALLLGGPSGLLAQSPPAPPAPPTMREVLDAALRSNPDIVAARLRVDSAHGEQRIARAIPNPVVNSAPNQPWQYTASMPLDIIPQRLFRTRAAARGTDAALSDAADVVRQVTFAVSTAFYDLLLAEQTRGLADERREIFRQLLSADSARLRAGDIPQRDVTKAVLELARADADLLRAHAQVHVTRLALQLLMGLAAPDTSFTVSGALTYVPVMIPEDSLAVIAARSRPDLRAARERTAQSTAIEHLAAALWVPIPELTYSYQHGGQFARRELFTNGASHAIGFGFTLPLFAWNGGEREKAARGWSQRSWPRCARRPKSPTTSRRPWMPTTPRGRSPSATRAGCWTGRARCSRRLGTPMGPVQSPCSSCWTRSRRGPTRARTTMPLSTITGSACTLWRARRDETSRHEVERGVAPGSLDGRAGGAGNRTARDRRPAAGGSRGGERVTAARRSVAAAWLPEAREYRRGHGARAR